MKKSLFSFPKIGRNILLICFMGILISCGQPAPPSNDERSASGQDNGGRVSVGVTEDQADEAAISADSTETAGVQDVDIHERKERFGENCIAEQTFEVILSEYDFPVYFVPYRPTEEHPEFYIEIKKNDETLTTIEAQAPSGPEAEKFASLDAVSFFDVNYDGNTDIVLLLTYGDSRFASIYYGYGSGPEAYLPYFSLAEQLSAAVTDQVKQLSISEIRTFLSGGKANGDFSSYQEAYEYVCQLSSLESGGKYKYDLIHTNEDDVPELVVGREGLVSLYAYHNGTVYTLMDQWPYGAAGNSGYFYCPEMNSFLNYNTDYAGAILYESYMSISENFSLMPVVQIVHYNFNDANQNGIPDEDELDSLGQYGISYIDGVEVSAKECEAYRAGEYELIFPTLSLEELRAKLKQ